MRAVRAFLTASLLAVAVPASERPADAMDEVVTRVYLNGIPTPVSFSDGDSFKILGGAHDGARTRLAGFNTLESFGPVHRWGDWHAKELYFLAKQATYNARRGVWHCTSEDMSTDTYGRMLWHCPDLARDQIRRGLAHAMSIDETPADETYIAAQRQAIRARRGIWAHGVPAFIMTSIHSASEGGGSDDGTHYNRLVSSHDGHSNSMAHKDTYEECSWVCTKERSVSDEVVQRIVESTKAHADLAPVLDGLTDRQIEQIARDFAALGWIAMFGDDGDDKRARVERALGEILAGEGMTGAPEGEGSCMLYVDFEKRYGKGRPECLR